jgi:hypothetical protein
MGDKSPKSKQRGQKQKDAAKVKTQQHKQAQVQPAAVKVKK